MQTAVDGGEETWDGLSAQDDLCWDLGAISHRHEAIAFLMQFQNRFCIYSPFVQKLYSSYQFIIPKDEDVGHITILPDPFAFHDTFNGVPRRCVEETGVFLYPGEVTGGAGLVMRVPTPGRVGSSREFPFAEGLRTVIREWRDRGRLFLPVLQNGDLREFENRMPSLHLHCVNLERIDRQLSALTIAGMRTVIADNVLKLFKDFGG